MPWSNIIGVPHESLQMVIDYLVDVRHDHHKEYKLSPLQVIGARSVADFQRMAGRNLQLGHNRQKRGRRPKNSVTWYVVRMPDYTRLTESERKEFWEAMVGEAGEPLLIGNSHYNRLTHAEDLNMLVVEFDEDGDPVRDRTQHRIRCLRRKMDEVTDALNVKRIERGIAPIQTMREVQRASRLLEGKIDLADELAALPIPPTTLSALKPALLSLGCVVPRFNPELDYLTIERTAKNRKIIKFRRSILKLLAAIRDAINRRRAAMKLPEPTEQPSVPLHDDGAPDSEPEIEPPTKPDGKSKTTPGPEMSI